jgi:hypothetical protein
MRRLCACMWLLVLVLPVAVAGAALDSATQPAEAHSRSQEEEWGDAPEGLNPPVIAYPSTGVLGQFPTCARVDPAGLLRHWMTAGWFGPNFDSEGDGNAANCFVIPSFPPYDADECFADGDAGLLIPDAYTIIGPLPPGMVVPCAPPVVNADLGPVCQTAVWGVDIDIDVTNNMPSNWTALVNVLVDWDQSGFWFGSSPCPGGLPAPEHVLVNFPVQNGYSGPLSLLNPPPFLIGPNPGYVWSRFTISESPVPMNWDGSAMFEDGETEDYLLHVRAPSPVEEGTWGCIKSLYR